MEGNHLATSHFCFRFTMKFLPSLALLWQQTWAIRRTIRKKASLSLYTCVVVSEEFFFFTPIKLLFSGRDDEGRGDCSHANCFQLKTFTYL
jgi:hypothetical protein